MTRDVNGDEITEGDIVIDEFTGDTGTAVCTEAGKADVLFPGSPFPVLIDGGDLALAPDQSPLPGVGS